MNNLNSIKKLNKSDLLNLKKETLIKIINLNDYLNDDFIIQNISKKIEKIHTKEIKIICEIRLSSILDDLEKIKYKDKKKFDLYSLYVYEDKKVLYLSNKISNLKEIKEILNENFKVEKCFELWSMKNELIGIYKFDKIDEIFFDLNHKKIKKIIIKNNPIL